MSATCQCCFCRHLAALKSRFENVDQRIAILESDHEATKDAIDRMDREQRPFGDGSGGPFGDRRNRRR